MQEELEQRLWLLAKDMAEEADLRITVPCANMIQDLAKAGVHRMMRAGSTSEAEWDEAELNWQRLVEGMITAAKEMTPGEFRESGFIEGKKLCPLRPFC